MRLWHESLIKYLPRQQLLGQHRECAALRGLGWGKSHSTVNYVFKHGRIRLYCYHYLVMREMIRRGYSVDSAWWQIGYRGKACDPDTVTEQQAEHVTEWISSHGNKLVYTEHDEKYLLECLDNLKNKNINLKVS